jgi:7-cyano-7-deazaguanine synthase in queuosine biosynthesis
MKDVFILEPTNTRYVISENFPEPEGDKKVGVFLSGGLESTLISKIAISVYGRDRVITFYSDEIFTAKDPNGNRNVWTNVSNSAELLGSEAVYLPFDYDLHMSNPIASAKKLIEDGAAKYNVDFTLWGFTKLFFNVSNFKCDPNSTHESILAQCMADPVKYKDVLEEFHLYTGQYAKYIKDLEIPSEVYNLLDYDKANGYKIKSPFRTLNKGEVIDLYRQLESLDIAYKTRSCVTDSISLTGKHCGVCFNCQQRYDAFAVLGLEDKTEYQSDQIKSRWELLQKEMNKL